MAKVNTEQSELSPLQILFNEIQANQAIADKAKSDGLKLFNLVTDDRATASALAGLIYQESLLELMLYTIDHRNAITARVSQRKSAESKLAKKEVKRLKVFAWCDANPVIAWQKYPKSVPLASEATSLAPSTVEEFISEWRDLHPNKFPV